MNSNTSQSGIPQFLIIDEHGTISHADYVSTYDFTDPSIRCFIDIYAMKIMHNTGLMGRQWVSIPERNQ